jgi:hypothetical protein
LTNAKEKKSESERRLTSDDFLGYLEGDTAIDDGPNGLIAKTEADLERIRTDMERASPNDKLTRRLLNIWGRVLNNELAEKYGHKLTLLSLYNLALEIEALRSQVNAQPTEEIDRKIEEGIEKIDKAVAKRLAQLHDPHKGDSYIG